MQPIEFEQSTLLSAPGTQDLPVIAQKVDGGTVISSFWTPTDEEAAAMMEVARRRQAGEPVQLAVQLRVWGNHHPAVDLHVAQLEYNLEPQNH